MLVLASNRDTSKVVKGKDAQMAKWDEEVRKSLASKKGNAPALTKQQQALVTMQLEKERQVRERVIGIKAQVDRGLALVKSVVNASVEEFPPYIAPITKLMLDGVLRNGKALVGQEAFNVYLVSFVYYSGQCVADNGGGYVGTSTMLLREIGHVPKMARGCNLEESQGQFCTGRVAGRVIAQ
jgi:hypothetical protein